MKNFTRPPRWLFPLPAPLRPYMAAVLYTLLFLLPLLGYPQGTAPVSGRITDEKGQPVPGVTVILKGTNTGTVTDAAGTFRINAPGAGVLVISSIGFTSQEIPVNQRGSIQVTGFYPGRTYPGALW